MKNAVIGMFNWMILVLNVFILVLGQMPEKISTSHGYYQMVYAVVELSIFVIVAIPVAAIVEWLLKCFTKLNEYAIDAIAAFTGLIFGMFGEKIISLVIPNFMEMLEYIKGL